MKQTIRIVAAVVDTRQLTLYKVDGTTLTIPQGDPRLRKIVEVATPQLIAKKYADVVIEEEDNNSYAKFEEQGSGVVRFFRVAKDKLANLFTPKVEEVPDTSPVTPLSIGPVPVTTTAEPASPVKPVVAAPVDPVAEIMQTSLDAINDTLGLPREVLPAVSVSPTPAQDHIANAGIHDVSEADEVAAAIEAAGGNGDEGTDDDEETFEPVAPAVEAKVEQTMDAVNEILAHAIPVSSKDFHEKTVAKQGDIAEKSGHTIQKHDDNPDSPDTIVAVVDGKILPGMERIKTQFNRAAKMGSTQGVERFLQRLAAVIEDRRHSIDDLLKFMERGDLPIADDGTILIYKVLRRRGSRTDGKFVDCHSGKVEQWTGAYVCMDPSLVDPNRRNECSNGLHVARRGYIRNFSGDVCVLAKLAPEDVIAVPEYDANKMRVCGYHILMELSDAQYNLVRSNRPITEDEEGKRLLANAIAGNHVHKTHEVRITGQMGAGVTTRKLEKTKEQQAPVLAKVESVTALANPGLELLDEPTVPLDVVQKVEEQKQLSRKDQAAALYAKYQASKSNDDLEALRAFKKAAKVNWDKLGITDTYVMSGLPESTKTPPMPKVKPPKVKVKATKKARKAAAKAKVKQTTKPTPKAPPAPAKRATFPKVKMHPAVQNNVELEGEQDRRKLKLDDEPEVKAPSEGSARERILKLLAIGLDSKDIAQSVLAIKKASKKSWDYLGVRPDEVTEILKQTEGK